MKNKWAITDLSFWGSTLVVNLVLNFFHLNRQTAKNAMRCKINMIWHDNNNDYAELELIDNPDRLLNWPIRAGISSTGMTDPRATTLLYINNRLTELSESVCDSFESVSQQPKMWAPQRNFITIKKGMNVPASGTTHYLYLCPWRACFSPFLGAFSDQEMLPG